MLNSILDIENQEKRKNEKKGVVSRSEYEKTVIETVNRLLK